MGGNIRVAIGGDNIYCVWWRVRDTHLCLRERDDESQMLNFLLPSLENFDACIRTDGCVHTDEHGPDQVHALSNNAMTGRLTSITTFFLVISR